MSWKMTLEELVTGTRGQVIQTGLKEFTGVSTDTRKDNKGKIFFALKGENFDAHDFCGKAVESGAAALVVHRDVSVSSSITIIKVKDTLEALQSLGTYWRHKCRAQIIGITGTNGKTTTKDFAMTLISSKYKTKATLGNLNNYIGLPLSLLMLEEETQVGVFEMGLSIPDEMKLLAKIGDPDVVVVTSVGRAHLQGFGSLEAVAANKEQIYSGARPNATRIFNLDNAFTKKMKSRAPREGKVLTYSSQESDVDVTFREVIATIDYLEIKGTIAGEPGSAKIPVFGRHNIANLMAAACLALAVGVEPDRIWKALPNCRGYWGRNQQVKLKSGATVLFDGYNANPDSVEALLKNVSRLKLGGRLFAVFGDMLELGDDSDELHRTWGAQAAAMGFEGIWFVGSKGAIFQEGARSAGFRKNVHHETAWSEGAILKLRDQLNSGDVVLVKGSRGMKLERAVVALDPLDFSPTAKG